MAKTLKLQGQLALVTGASSGIGQEYARQLAALGADLIIAARRQDRLQTLAEELQKAYGVKVDCISVDLSQPGSAKELFQRATANGRQITYLIYSAGLGKYGSLLDFAYEDHHATIQVNSVTPTELTYLMVKHMLGHGRESYITQVASIAAFQPVGFFTVYSASKGYMRYFAETVAFELRKTNVHMTCVCPGGTYTEFFEHSGQKITSTGHATMMTAEAVVKSGLAAMFRGQTVFVPGLLNKIACFLPRLLPRNLGLFLAFKTMNRAVERVNGVVVNPPAH